MPEIPEAIRERLAALDRLLFVEWNGRTCRWEIWRRNAVKANGQPDRIKVWTTEKGEYLPLDARLIAWLNASDLRRKFKDIDERHWATLQAREIDEANEKRDADVKKREDDRAEEVCDELAFAIKKGDKGIPYHPKNYSKNT